MVNALFQFEQGASGQSVFSFDSHLRRTGVVEISGTEGTLSVPDPNTFAGDVRITRASFGEGDPVNLDQQGWRTIPSVGVEAGRGLGVLDMARAIRAGVAHIATGDLGYHVLEVLTSLETSVTSASFLDIASTVGPIPLVPEDRDPYASTL